jgi:hypothetical protein
VIDGGLLSPAHDLLRRRRSPGSNGTSTANASTPAPDPISTPASVFPDLIIPGFPLLPPGVPAYLTLWTPLLYAQTLPTGPGALQLSTLHLNATHSMLQWNHPRATAPGPLIYRFFLKDPSGVTVRTFLLLDLSVAGIVISDSELREEGADGIAVQLQNSVGASEVSNTVELQPAVSSESVKVVNHRQSVTVILIVVLPTCAVLTLLFLYLCRWRRRDTVVSFPPKDQWELDPEEVRALFPHRCIPPCDL